MDYPSGDCSLSSFDFIMCTNSHIDTAKCFTPTTVVGVSNKGSID